MAEPRDPLDALLSDLESAPSAAWPTAVAEGRPCGEDDERIAEIVRRGKELFASLRAGTPAAPEAASSADAATKSDDPTPRSEESGEVQYRFPTQAELEGEMSGASELTDDELLRALRALGTSFEQHEGHRSYRGVRARFCALSLEVNRRGLRAPRFRDLPGMHFKNRKATLEASLYNNDRQVIDLHWLNLHHQHIRPMGTYSDLLEGRDLDYERASQFAKEKWKRSSKATTLGLSERDELMLAAICSDAGHDRWKAIVQGERKCRRLVATAALAARSRLPKDGVQKWVNVQIALRISRGSCAEAARLLRWISGETITARAMVAKKKWLDDLAEKSGVGRGALTE